MTKLEKDWIDAYFENGVDVANRRVFLDSDIEDQSIGYAIKGLYLMETASKVDPVEMFISSYGGEIYEALALYDIMNTISCPIHTFAYGKCMSAAPLLLAAGEIGHRWVAPHVTFMHHDWAAHIEGKGTELQTLVKHCEDVSQIWTGLLSKHSNKDFKWWHVRAKKSADFYFKAEDALEWGLADHIWVEK